MHELENEREPLQLELMDLKQELDGAAEEVLGEGKARKQADLHAKEVRARERLAAKLLLKAEKRALDAASFLHTSLAQLHLTLPLALALPLTLTLTNPGELPADEPRPATPTPTPSPSPTPTPNPN